MLSVMEQFYRLLPEAVISVVVFELKIYIPPFFF